MTGIFGRGRVPKIPEELSMFFYCGLRVGRGIPVDGPGYDAGIPVDGPGYAWMAPVMAPVWPAPVWSRSQLPGRLQGGGDRR